MGKDFTIKIQKTGDWDEALNLLNHMSERYGWFRFEFGKRATKIFYDLLKQEIRDVKYAPKDYKKRLTMAEFRDTSKQSWFAVIVQAKKYSKSEKVANACVIKVIPRFMNIAGFDPIRDILYKYGPWTVDTLPFVPELQYAVSTVDSVSEAEYEATKVKNQADLGSIRKLAVENRVEYDSRIEIMQKLKIVDDFEEAINKIEFGNGPQKNPHWSPALRKFYIQMLRRLANEKDLMQSMLDPNFQGYKTRKHLKIQLKKNDIIALDEFRRRVFQKV